MYCFASSPGALLGLLVFGGAVWAQLPAPTGLHRVGRASFYWTDAKRAEPAAETPGAQRRIAVHAWYPGAPEGGVPAPYLPSAGRLLASTAAGALSRLFGASWPAIISNQLRTHSFEKLAVKDGARLPVLVFSPGEGAPVAAYTAQMEELASHGYVVMGVEHTYEAPGVVFPDGRVVGVAREYWEHLRQESGGDFEQRVAAGRAADLVFVVEQLERDGEAIFRRRLDLGKIGVFGHGRGGRAAALACQMERRIRACGSQGGGAGVVRQPLLVVDDSSAEVRPAGGGVGYQVLIRGLGSLMDSGLLGQRASAMAYTRAFFDRHLRGFRGTLGELAGGSVEVRRFGGSRE